MTDLNGKAAIVTGAGSGIGAATAIHFAKLGAKLTLTDRYGNLLEETKQKCIENGSSEEKINIVVANLLDGNEIKTIPAKTVEKFGKLDILVNCAGATFEGGDIRGSIEIFDKTMNINVKSIIMLTQCCLDQLIENKGAIVNVSSVASVLQFPSIYYCMSKASLDQFTKCLAVEMAPHQVRVNSVNPGQIETPLIQTSFGMTPEENDQYMKEMGAKHPIGRIGKPLEVAKAIAYLASEDASFTTGQTLFVDGAVRLTNNIATKPAEVKSG